ncbi:hypothetical protein IIG_05949 [Bacillus cereus VD048]|uniref:Uncharacterized protein n=1 Tax=Bacillus cereus VD048 TaxID=1053226 RepID=J8HA31_BACCE|nr:hypothetical protein IIG_05949 [Bacillus cereus VD048]
MSFSTELINQSTNNLVSHLAILFVPPLIVVILLALIVRRYFYGNFTRQLFGPAAACIVVCWIWFYMSKLM